MAEGELDFGSDYEEANNAINAVNAVKPPQQYFFRASASDFRKIPGSPIAYWINKKILSCFLHNKSIGEVSHSSEGIKTGNNEFFLRFWYEVSWFACGDLSKKSLKWIFHHKGGDFRKWAGNQEYVIFWENNGQKIINSKNSGIQGDKIFYKESSIWSDITSSGYSARIKYINHLFDSASPSGFLLTQSNDKLLAYLNSIIVKKLTPVINPTLHFKVGNFRSLPYKNVENINIKKLVNYSQSDWDSYETSWDFTSLPLLKPEYRKSAISESYKSLRLHWKEMTLEMQKLEEENNRIFIEAYGLEDELTPDVPLNEITLTCNPHYRYGGGKSDTEYEKLLLADTVEEYISYSVGCMFGRYSLDKEGLVLANAGDEIDDYLKIIPQPSFMPDKSGIIPITDENDFANDLANQFKTFLKISFGSEKYDENLRFIEEVLGKDIRNYFIRDFFKDHVKRYKTRPIYWMISSPTSAFKALIYIHRYTKDTIGILSNDYIRPYRKKLETKIEVLERTLLSGGSAGSDKIKAQSAIDKYRKTVRELENWERDVVYPLAVKRIELDLDDGVKVNYARLGAILEKVKGLNG